MIQYSEVIFYRKKIVEKFPQLIRKPRNWQDYVCEGGKVLNFGSGDVNAEHHKEIKNVFKNVCSCDSDPAFSADYLDLNLIDDKFDLIVGEHVLEHIETKEVINIAKKFNSLLNDNGKLVLTIPNLNNFSSYFGDFDHKNSAPPVDLAAIVCCANFELIDFFRWSKLKHMQAQLGMNEAEKFIEHFMERHYGLQTDRYITMVHQKNGKI